MVEPRPALELPIRVAFDSSIFMNQVIGGISRYYVRLMEALPAQRIDPVLLAPFYINRLVAELPRAMVHGRAMRTGHVRAAAARRWNGVVAPRLMRGSRAALVHQTYYGDHARVPAWLPRVITVYDMIHELFPAQFVGDHTPEVKREAVRRADRILCISESTRNDLLRFYPEVADRVSVTLLGFDPAPGRAARDDDILADTSRPYLLHVGPRGGYKNFLAFLEAFGTSPSLRGHFRILCVGGGTCSAEELEFAQRLGVADLIAQTDADDSELQRLYAGAAAFVYPSLYEGFGIPPLEAMAAGCPVVALRTSSVPEVCGDAAEYGVPGDMGSLRDAIERVVNSPTHADTMRARGAERLRAFSWQRCAEQTAAVYRDIA